MGKCSLLGRLMKYYWIELKLYIHIIQFSSVGQSCPTLCDPMQHTRLPCPSPTPRANSNSCLSRWWCHPTISPSVVPFSSCLQSFPASGSFPMSQLFFASGGQSIGVSASASVLPMNIQDWFPLGLTGWITTIIIIHYYLTIILGLEKHWSKRMTRRSIYMYYLLEKY